MTISFLNGWTIALDKLPEYKHFKKPFQIQVETNYLKQILNSTTIESFNEDRKKILLPIINAINKKNVLVSNYCPRHELGRFYPENSISLICLPRHIKHTFFNQFGWIDLDMSRGHSTLIYEIAKKNNFHNRIPSFKKYIDNPDEIMETLVDYYGCKDTDNAKDIFNLSIYGGGHTTWLEQMDIKKIELKTREIHPFVKSFIDECRKLSDTIYYANPDLSDRVRGELTDLHEIQSRVMSYWCSTIENEIISGCFKGLEKKKLIDHSNCLPEYDGLCIRPKTDDDRNRLLSLIDDINEKIFATTGLNVKMKWKPYKSQYLHNAELIREFGEYETDNSKFVTFKEMAEEFEKTHCKIISTGCFVSCLGGRIIVSSETKFRTTYRHLSYYEEKTRYMNGHTINDVVEKNFIDKWLNTNPNMRIYDEIDCFPPPLKCPDDTFNTWTPYTMASIQKWVYKPIEVKQLLDHISIMCNHNQEVTDYLIKWIAQMLQYPAVKTTCPVIISKQGSGKSTLIHMIEKMIGHEKMLETSNPNRDVWGDFNSAMQGKMFINLNEISGKDTSDSMGQIKALITDTNLIINGKGVSAYPIKCYARFMITTNNPDPIKSTKDDRRFAIWESSNELIGNKKYFDNIYKNLEDMNVIKSLYEYFMGIPDMDKFNNIPLPKTEYQMDMQEQTVSPIELWLKDYIENYEGYEEELQLKSKEIYDDFVTWRFNSNVEYHCNNVQFAVRLKRLNIDGVGTRHSRIRYTTLNVNKLKKYFGIGCLLN